MLAMWAEADLVVADEFRDRNVPARQAPVNCARLAFAALPATIRGRYVRGDSACHERALLAWLDHPDRAQEPGAPVGFAMSAMVEARLAAALTRVDDRQWTTYPTESDGTRRRCVEVDFVPTDVGESRERRPLHYVGLRLLKAQSSLFADGSDRHHCAVITHLDWAGDRLLKWHREKAGIVEHVHDEVKNALGGGHMPAGSSRRTRRGSSRA